MVSSLLYLGGGGGGGVDRPVVRGNMAAQVEVTDVHVRYEDTTSCAGTQFAIGATFKRFATASTPTGSGGHVRSRTAVLEQAAVYWDTHTAEDPPLVQFASLAPADMMRAFAEGVTHRAAHVYVASPSTPTVLVTTNPDMVPGVPRLKAELALTDLAVALNYEQFRCATYLQQWVALHQFRPTQSVTAAPRHWWHYAVKCVCGHRGGGAHRQAARWDFRRVIGASARRRRYVELWKHRLLADAAAAGEDVGAAAALPTGIAREIDNVEIRYLTVEQALLYRYLAEASCTVALPALLLLFCCC